MNKPCPKQHTETPTGYIEYHEWAEKKMKTHYVTRCIGCGLYKIWIPIKQRSSNGGDMNYKIEKHIGSRYGRYEIIREVEPAVYGNDRSRCFRCRCDCGTEKTVQLNNLRSGDIRSCGCLKIERMTTHGLAKHPLYKAWCGMKDRVANLKCKDYQRYGGRGITICDEWSDDPTAFVAWAESNGWELGLQIDRIDNNGNYTPDNCRFVTRTENIRNSTVVKLSVAIIKEIRKAHAYGLGYNIIGKIYGVGGVNISNIIAGRSWK